MLFLLNTYQVPLNIIGSSAVVTCPPVAGSFVCDPNDCSMYYNCVWASDPNPVHMPCNPGTLCDPAIPGGIACQPEASVNCTTTPPTSGKYTMSCRQSTRNCFEPCWTFQAVSWTFNCMIVSSIVGGFGGKK